MIIIDNCIEGPHQKKGLVLIFGLGLIGSSIFKHIKTSAKTNLVYRAFSWDSHASRKMEKSAILDSVDGLLASPPDSQETQIDIVWSAGKAGFSGTNDELLSEESAFLDVLDLAIVLSKKYACKQRTCFHLLSSAGALFEGQINVDENTKILPLRPYGYAKHRQENFLLEKRNF